MGEWGEGCENNGILMLLSPKNSFSKLVFLKGEVPSPIKSDVYYFSKNINEIYMKRALLG